jgi:hypothetical protein
MHFEVSKVVVPLHGVLRYCPLGPAQKETSVSVPEEDKKLKKIWQVLLASIPRKRDQLPANVLKESNASSRCVTPFQFVLSKKFELT